MPDDPARSRMRDGSRLRDVVSGDRSRERNERGEPGPQSTYEAVTRQMVRSLRDELRDVKSRINQLITLVIAAILLEIVMRMIGV
jgi:hypothetical protein